MLTDRDTGALELIDQNAREAGVAERCTALPLTWGEGRAAENEAVLEAAGTSGGYQLLLAADVVRRPCRPWIWIVQGLAQVWQSVADAGVLAQIYAVEVVAPLFWSVGRLLSPSAAPPSATESGAPPQLLMCQSFPYDAATEAEMDRAAAAARLERVVLADGLGGEGAGERVKVQSFRRARSGNEL